MRGQPESQPNLCRRLISGCQPFWGIDLNRTGRHNLAVLFYCENQPTSAVELDVKEVERFWRRRLNDARLRLDFARNYVIEIERALPKDERLEPEFQEAQAARDVARGEYFRVLKIYKSLDRK